MRVVSAEQLGTKLRFFKAPLFNVFCGVADETDAEVCVLLSR